MGLIKQENVNSFNLPLYFANAKEVVGIVEGNGYFSIEKIQELNKYFSTMGTTTIDMQSFITSNVRAVVEGVMNEHFGHKIVDELFRSFPKKLDNCNFISDDEFCKDVDLFILLKRKVPS
ncbi:SAM dependent carboxyl methyltransferase [Corchorus olitorius]|uniref:SAM dependent carboxyl methyltransferase n=1 Tax=Corchorus olitorius TaxID=93759 RepID=A0A1R3HSN6_9ROSI|nr:SAM dependent carboxyl methyltransferase [Corchorus olitorius]